MKSNFATPTRFGSVSCFVVGFCLSNYNLNSFLIQQASYSKGCQWYIMHREVFGSIWKIGRYPIKVSEVLALMLAVSLLHFAISRFTSIYWIVMYLKIQTMSILYNIDNIIYLKNVQKRWISQTVKLNVNANILSVVTLSLTDDVYPFIKIRKWNLFLKWQSIHLYNCVFIIKWPTLLLYDMLKLILTLSLQDRPIDKGKIFDI